MGSLLRRDDKARDMLGTVTTEIHYRVLTTEYSLQVFVPTNPDVLPNNEGLVK